MPIRPKDLRDLASRLASQEATECELRTSISRAYYSAFHTLLPFVERLPPSEPKMRGQDVNHTEMDKRLTQWDTAALAPSLARLTSTKAQVRRALNAARMSRVKADYALTATVTLGEAKQQLERVSKISFSAAQLLRELAPAIEKPSDSEIESPSQAG